MIHSLFIINTAGDIVLEKHWKSVIHRSLCDYFFDAQKRASSAEDVQPIISTPHHYLINVYHNKLYFVAVVTSEVPPLLVIEFLHRVVETFAVYFEDCSDNTIKENYVIVFELLDEMLDNGFPLATEINILEELIQPPRWFRNLTKTVTGKSTVSETLPSGQLSNVPWRRAGVKYTNNEAYFDVIEEIDAIIDKQGGTVFAEIQGYIDCCIKLSGMPDLTLTFMNPRILDDVSFHPCVRFKRWENERILSFVPPDGTFRLLSYHIGSQNMVAIPIYLKHSINLQETNGRLEITVGPRQSMGKILEDVSVEMPLPKSVQNCALVATQGRYTFDTSTKLLTWTVGKVELSKPTTLKGTVSFDGWKIVQTGGGGKLLVKLRVTLMARTDTVVTISPEEAPIAANGIDGNDQHSSAQNLGDTNPNVNVFFRISQTAASGLKVNRLDMYGEQYKPFKGVKYVTKAGRFQVRT